MRFVTPPVPDVSGVPELADRWGVSRQMAARVVERPGFPAPRKLAMGRVWSDEDVATWEAAERAAGRPIPGESPRGYRAGDGPPRGGRRS